jgi:hypothetical protein
MIIKLEDFRAREAPQFIAGSSHNLVFANLKYTKFYLIILDSSIRSMLQYGQVKVAK